MTGSVFMSGSPSAISVPSSRSIADGPLCCNSGARSYGSAGGVLTLRNFGSGCFPGIPTPAGLRHALRETGGRLSIPGTNRGARADRLVGATLVVALPSARPRPPLIVPESLPARPAARPPGRKTMRRRRAPARGAPTVIGCRKFQGTGRTTGTPARSTPA